MNPFGDRLGAMGWLVAGAGGGCSFRDRLHVAAFAAGERAGRIVGRDLSRGGHLSAVGIRAENDLPAQVPTTVSWNVETLRIAASGDAQRGSALAAGCAGCHGAKGISPADAFPNLAGLPADVMYKQLDDYRTGKRQNPIMQGMAAALSDQQIADLAAHFAALPAGQSGADASAPALVRVGSPTALDRTLRRVPRSARAQGRRATASRTEARLPQGAARRIRRRARGTTTSTSRCAKWRGR